MAKFSELWAEVEKTADEGRQGNYMAVLLAHKVLLAVLSAKGYPGKTIEDKLFWAGYSGKDKEGITEAIGRRNDIIEKIDYEFTDFESQEAVRMYKKIAQDIVAKPELTFSDKYKAYYEMYFSPKSFRLWRNLAIVFGTFISVKLLSETEIGKKIVESILNISNFVISWIFVAIVLIIAAIVIGIGMYFENRSKIKIKE